MKKILTVFLICCFFLGGLSLPVLAEGAVNLIPDNNATFESGASNWAVLGGGKVAVTANPHGEGKVLCYSEAPQDKSYATPMLDIRSYVQKTIKEETTLYGSFDVYSELEAQVVIRLRTKTENGFSACEEAGKPYCTLGNFSAEADTWTHVEFSFDITDSDLQSTENWNFCFDNINKLGETAVYLDNFYFSEEEPETPEVNLPEKTPVSRNAETLIGTIRWDAFTQSTSKGDDPASQVARVLSPAKYHAQTPFFGKVEADGSVSFPEYTVQTWEAEAEYASAAGLDYFAYLWYESSSAMSQPRKLHLESRKKNLIKMCGILESLNRTEKTMKELFDAMQDECYLCLNGRPVVFLYDFDNWDASDVQTLRQQAILAGVEKALYIVGMSTSVGSNFLKNKQKDADAFSWYSIGAQKKDETYAELAAHCEDIVEKMGDLCAKWDIDLIPSFTAGRDSRARIQTGVSWVKGDPQATADENKPYANRYALPPTMEELKTHIARVVAYANDHADICKTNLVCSYGWNEHEEGGWLCPTLACDEQGNVLYKEDGTPEINTERLAALKAVLAGDVVADNKGDAAATATEVPATAAPAGDTAKKTMNPLIIICPAIAVLVVAGAAVIIVIKKKKEQREEE